MLRDLRLVGLAWLCYLAAVVSIGEYMVSNKGGLPCHCHDCGRSWELCPHAFYFVGGPIAPSPLAVLLPMPAVDWSTWLCNIFLTQVYPIYYALDLWSHSRYLWHIPNHSWNKATYILWDPSFSLGVSMHKYTYKNYIHLYSDRLLLSTGHFTTCCPQHHMW